MWPTVGGRVSGAGPILLLLLAQCWTAAGGDEEEPCGVVFLNDGPKSAELFWLSPEADKRFVASLEPNSAHRESTYTGHRFLIAAADGSEQMVEIQSAGKVRFRSDDQGLEVAEEGAVLAPGTAPRQTAEYEAHAGEQRARCAQIFRGFPEDAAHFCSRDHDSRNYIQSPLRHKESDWLLEMATQSMQREDTNRNQPKELPKFTKVGFQVATIPETLRRRLQDFHVNNRLESVPEDHGVFDPNLSGRQSDTWLSQVPPRMRRVLSTTLRPILADWAGFDDEELILTAIYGIRLYHNGSILHMHVDRKETHVISAILEVGHLLLQDQSPESSWPLRIYDHSGREHVIPNKPGQMILYESSTCPHGRPDPFVGREMANVFVHFKPRGWPQVPGRSSSQECDSARDGGEGSCSEI